jgi:protein SCO1/2
MKLVAAAILGTFLILAGCSSSASQLPSYGAVPEFQLTAQDGSTFDSKALDGQVWVADFMFTSCPGPCPRMTSQMHEVQSAIQSLRGVKLVSFTVDPARDTPAVLAAYAKVHGASSERWYFLTGPQSTLHHLCRDVFKLGDVDGKLMHSTRFILMDRKSQIRAYYDTSESGSIQQLISDVKALAREGA